MSDTDMTRFAATFAPEPDSPRVALINMCSDEKGEAAFRSLMPADTRYYTARVGVDLDAYIQGRFELFGGFDFVASSLPAPDRIDLIAFSCTSGTIAGGDGFIEQGFMPTHPGIPCTNPATAAAAGLRAFGARSIALLTPYPAKVHAKFLPFFADRGIAITSHGSFDLTDDALVGRIEYDAFLTAGRDLISNRRPDALFISCAAFDVVDKLDALSRQLGLPVYSSSQLFAWHARQLLGLGDPFRPEWS